MFSAQLGLLYYLAMSHDGELYDVYVKKYITISPAPASECAKCELFSVKLELILSNYALFPMSDAVRISRALMSRSEVPSLFHWHHKASAYQHGLSKY